MSITSLIREGSSKTKLDKIINILILLDMILIGSDRIAIKVGGMTLRFVQLLLLATFVAIYLNKQFKIVDVLIFIPFIAGNIISTIYSYAPVTSITYIIWTIYNYLIVYCLFFSWSRTKKKEDIVDLWFLSFAIQAIYVVIQFIIGKFHINDPFFDMQVYFEVYRPAIWFYEPSYLATYFVVYFFISGYLYIHHGKSKYRNHMWIAYICLLIISSSTGYLGIALGAGAVVLFSITTFNKEKLKRIGVVIVSFSLILTVMYVTDPNRYQVFGGRIFKALAPANHTVQPDIKKFEKTEEVITNLADSSIGISSGLRVDGWLETLGVFEKHPLIGIGPNSYAAYTGQGLPPTNVTLEILANLGVLGFITFAIFIIGILIKSARRISKDDHINKAILIAFIIFAIVLQANQNYLRLYMWLQLGILSGCCYGNERLRGNNKFLEYNKD